jgi:hypothetical protein
LCKRTQIPYHYERVFLCVTCRGGHALQTRDCATLQLPCPGTSAMSQESEDMRERNRHVQDMSRTFPTKCINNCCTIGCDRPKLTWHGDAFCQRWIQSGGIFLSNTPSKWQYHQGFFSSDPQRASPSHEASVLCSIRAFLRKSLPV